MNNFKLKENINFPLDSFIGTSFIPKNLCDEIIKYFKKNKNLTHKGYFGANSIVNVNIKESNDLEIKVNANLPLFNKYFYFLQNILNEYIKIYPEVNKYARFKITEDVIIQHYPPKGGFKIWHHENGGVDVSKRILVFMTYLNSVKNAGTEFKYQKLISPCKKGLTLIWPTHFTHTHRGVINNKKEKYIITGWFSLI